MQTTVRSRLSRRITAATASSLMALGALTAQGTMQVSGFDLEVIAPMQGGLDSITRARGGELGDDLICTGTGGAGGRSIWRVPASGGEPEELLSGQAPFLYLEAVPGGSFYTVNSTSGGDLRELRMQNGALTLVRSLTGATNTEGLLYVDSGPHQGKLFFTNRSPKKVRFLDVQAGSSTVTDFQTLTQVGYDGMMLATLPGSSFGNDFFTVDYNGRVYRLDGTNESVFTTLPSGLEAIAAPPLGSGFGQYLFGLGFNGALYRIDPQGGVAVFADGFDVSIYSSTLDFSPDGRHLYVASDQEPWITRITPNGLARCAYRNGTGANEDACRCATVPVLGSAWDVSVDIAPETFATFVFASADGIAPIPLPFGELQIGALLGDIGGNGTHTLAVPSNLPGYEIYLQGARVNLVGSAIELELVNSLRAVFGS